jgi:hypothetical protein
MDNFVRTVSQVNKVQTALKEKLPTLQNPADAARLQQESTAEMTKIIEGCSMKVDRYNELARSVSGDAELNKRFQAKQQELGGAGNIPACAGGADKH